jgi:beta-lactamase regulating signal transducer with metallopeptidase domain
MHASDVAATLLSLVLGMALKSTVMLLGALAVAFLLRHRAAATRHLVWGVTLTGVLLLPLLSATLPRWDVPGIDRWAAWPAARLAAAKPHSVVLPTGPTTDASAPLPRRSVQAPATPASEPATEPEVAAPPSADTGSALVLWLAAAWLLGCFSVLLTVLLGLRRSTRLAHAAHPVTDRAVLALAETASEHLQLSRAVRLLRAPSPVMPMTWGVLRPVVLLPSHAAPWTAPQLEAVLLHEFAHIKRCDYLTQLIASVACALCWFHPLVWVAARQLRIEREHACDDLVLRAGSRASDYAQQLLDIARSLVATPLQSVATIAMARPSQLAGRLLAVLDGSRPRGVVSRRFVMGAAAAAAVIVVPLAGATTPRRDQFIERLSTAPPSAGLTTQSLPSHGLPSSTAKLRPLHPSARPGALQGCDWDNGEEQSASTNINNDRLRIRIKMGPDCRIDLDATGQIQFNDDFTDVTGLDRAGSFALEEREGRESHRLEIEPGPGGALVRSWYVNGQLQQRITGAGDVRGVEAQQWLARTLTVVFRRTGYQAEERGRWILAQRGISGLLDEIAHVRNDYATGKYYGVLLSQKPLDPATVDSVLQDAGHRIHSDYALSQLLQMVAEHQPMNATVQAAYVTAAANIDSDYQKARAFSAVLRRADLPQNVADSMLRQATTIESDYQLATLLKELIASHPLSASMTPVFFQAVGSLESDYQRRTVLSALLEKGAPSQDILDRTLEAAQGFSSDHDLAALLLEVAQKYPVDRALPPAYVKAASSLHSDHEKGRVWSALLDRREISPNAISAVLDAASDIGSDHELSTLLRALLQRHTLDDATRPAFFRAVSHIGSDHNTGQVLAAALDTKPLARATVLDVIRASSSIGSDEELGNLLIHIADVVTLDDELRAALRAASDRIGSSYKRGQVLAKIYPRGEPA